MLMADRLNKDYNIFNLSVLIKGSQLSALFLHDLYEYPPNRTNQISYGCNFVVTFDLMDGTRDVMSMCNLTIGMPFHLSPAKFLVIVVLCVYC